MKLKLKDKLTFGEEVGNSVTHGVMSVFVLIMYPISAIYAYTHGGALDVVGVSVFNISLFFMFLSSTLYHAMDFTSQHKLVFRKLDHIAIYVAIAGSYTPICLSLLKGWQGIGIVIFQWALVIFGILYKALIKEEKPLVSVIVYLLMGWVIIFIFPSFSASASAPLIGLMIAGGVSYSIGSLIYLKRGFKFHHLVWHIFVNIGAICHYIGIVFFMK